MLYSPYYFFKNKKKKHRKGSENIVSKYKETDRLSIIRQTAKIYRKK